MITENEFHRVVAYVKGRYGIDLSQKKVLVMGRLDNYILRNGYANYNQYMEEIESDPNGKEAANLINVLTTNHTYFMRESMHFDYLKQKVLPQLKISESGKKDLRIWSAASSTGEEPYTLAMIMKDFFGAEHKMWDTKILATDISTRVLEHAAKGVYLKEQIAPLPPQWKKHYFKPCDAEHYQATEELRQEVIFRQFNLMNPFPFKRKFHVVFLRNVMIYFEDDTKNKLLNKVYDFLEPGGYLFIGTTEGLNRSKTKFQFVEPSIYRK